MPKKKEPLVIIIKPGPREFTTNDYLKVRFGMTIEQFAKAFIEGEFDHLIKQAEGTV